METIFRIVGDPDRLVLGVISNDGQDRSENLLLGDCQFLERLLGGLKRADARLYDDPGELNDASVFLDHRGGQIVDSRRDDLVQPAQDLGALLLC